MKTALTRTAASFFCCRPVPRAFSSSSIRRQRIPATTAIRRRLESGRSTRPRRRFARRSCRSRAHDRWRHGGLPGTVAATGAAVLSAKGKTNPPATQNPQGYMFADIDPGGVSLSGAESSRLRGPRRPGAVGQQRHPQTARPAGAAWAAVGRRRHFVLLNSGWGLARPRAGRYGDTQKQTALNDQGFQVPPVDLTRAESSCARGAPSQRRRSAERPTFNWSAERPAIRPTRWRRLGGASAISFLGRERSIDHAAAAGRALGPTGYRQTGGTERSALSCPQRVPPLYPLTRAHEVDSATRWGRHLAAVADSIFAQFGSGAALNCRSFNAACWR